MTTFTQKGVTRPGAPLPRQLNYESDLLFHLRAADLLIGYDPTENVARAITSEAATFARTSAGGYCRDALGFLQPWGQGVPRIKMFDLDSDGYYETPGLMLEGARENAFTKSTELDDGAWTKLRATCAGAGEADAIEAPDGTVTADKLVEDGTAANTHGFFRNTPALTNDTQQSFSLFAKAAERSEIELILTQKDATQAIVWFDLDDGVVGTESGGAVGLIEAYADGWYRCMMMADSDAGGTAPVVSVNLGEGGETDTYDGDGASGAYFWGMQFEVDDAFPSEFIKTLAAAVTRNADSLTYTLPFLGLTMDDLTDDFTMYARMGRPFHADAVGALASEAGICQASSAAPSFKLFYRASTRNLRTLSQQNGGGVAAEQSIPSGAVLEALSQVRNLNTGGSVAIDVGSGLTAFSGADTAFSAFGDTTLLVGKDGAATSELFTALFELKIARGLRTFKQMQEAF